MLRRTEFLTKQQVFHYVDVLGNASELPIDEKQLCFTYCQVPILYKLSEKAGLEVVLNDRTIERFEKLSLTMSMSEKVFRRTGDIVQIIVHLNEAMLR